MRSILLRSLSAILFAEHPRRGWVSFRLPKGSDSDCQNHPSGYNFVLRRNELGTHYDHFGLGTVYGKAVATIHFFVVNSEQELPLNTWSHIAATYDGNTLAIYVNGAFAASFDVGWPSSIGSTITSIGANTFDQASRESWDGAIDEVKIFSSVLTAAQVAVEAL